MDGMSYEYVLGRAIDVLNKSIPSIEKLVLFKDCKKKIWCLRSTVF